MIERREVLGGVCINTGTIPLQLKLYSGTTTGTGLGTYLNLSILRGSFGTPPAYPSCSTFTAAGVVYAGTVADDPSQGVVVIRRSAPDWSESTPPETVRPPVKDGALKITAAAGTRLSLQSTQGGKYTLDAGTGALSRAAP